MTLFACVVLLKSRSKLIGARGVVSATDTRQQRFDLVDVFALHKLCNALQITAATADKAHVVHFVFAVHVEKNLTGTGSSGRISKHGISVGGIWFDSKKEGSADGCDSTGEYR